MKKKLWKSKASVRDNLQARLPGLAAKYFAAGRQGLAAGSPWEEMHGFRLETKRFRYTLEIFREAYGPGLRKRIEALKQVQTLLGDINDCIVTSSMLADVPGTEALRTKLDERARRWTEKLRKFWISEFDAPGQEVRWVRYLARFACRTVPASAPEESPVTEPSG
jgi:CHAD domain-containing protein